VLAWRRRSPSGDVVLLGDAIVHQGEPSVADLLGRLAAMAEAFACAYDQRVQAVMHQQLPTPLCPSLMPAFLPRYYHASPSPPWMPREIGGMALPVPQPRFPQSIGGQPRMSLVNDVYFRSFAGRSHAQKGSRHFHLRRDPQLRGPQSHACPREFARMQVGGGSRQPSPQPPRLSYRIDLSHLTATPMAITDETGTEGASSRAYETGRRWGWLQVPRNRRTRGGHAVETLPIGG
jgi:hypothetical protein